VRQAGRGDCCSVGRWGIARGGDLSVAILIRAIRVPIKFAEGMSRRKRRRERSISFVFGRSREETRGKGSDGERASRRGLGVWKGEVAETVRDLSGLQPCCSTDKHGPAGKV
jgi:hypothetical protein